MNFHIFLSGQEQTLNTNQIIFHGYINHNQSLLYESDAKAIISSKLESDSLECIFDSINGSFQFIYNNGKQLIFSIDHFGGYTLFYKITDKGIAIYDNPMIYPHKSKLNDIAVCSLLASGFTINDDTIFKDVRECMPGTRYTYDFTTGKLSSDVWFSYISTNSKSLNPIELNDIISGLYPPTKEGVHTLSLSGGIDSRFLFGCLLNRENQFETFSFGSELNDDKFVAQKIASLFHIPNTCFSFTEEICKNYYTSEHLDFIIKHCTFGRSLTNETDLIPSCGLNPRVNIVSKGFGGDFMVGRYIVPEVYKLKTFEDAVNYLFHKYFTMTCISSRSFKTALYAHLVNSIQSLYKANHKNIISTIEQWNLLHNERKYIVNTLSYYKAKGYKFYLPFYDRNYMNYMSHLLFTEKTDQNAYFRFLREHFFVGKLEPLKTSESLRWNFLAEVTPSMLQKLKNTSHNVIRTLDGKKIRKRFAVPTQKYYADSLMLFNHSMENKPFLQQKVVENFPEVRHVSSFLQAEGCIESAKHLDWLSSQQTGQANLNGLSLFKFFLNREFVNVLLESKRN